jgi:hypothetical protein
MNYKFFLATIIVFAGLLSVQNVFALTISPPMYELGGARGQDLRTGLKIFNETEKPGTFYFEVQNFSAQGEEGEPDFSQMDNEQGLATWIETPESIYVEPGELKKVDFTIRVPNDADPGGHYAVIFLSSSPPAKQGVGSVGMASKIGALVLLRIEGDVKEQGELIEFSIENSRFAYEHLPIGFSVRIRNNGTVHIKPAGTIKITNFFGKKTAEILVNIAKDPNGKLMPVGNILPQGARKFESIWTGSGSEKSPKGFLEKVKHEKDNFAMGRYTADLDLEYGLIERKSIKSQLVFWVFPWHLILAISSAVIFLMSLIIFCIKRYNKWIIKKATAEQ